MIPLLLPFGKRIRMDGLGAVHLYKGFELHDKAPPLRSVQKSMDSQRIVNGQSSFSHIKLMATKSQCQRKYGKWPSFQLDRLVTISQIKVFRLSVEVVLRLKATIDRVRPGFHQSDQYSWSNAFGHGSCSAVSMRRDRTRTYHLVTSERIRSAATGRRRLLVRSRLEDFVQTLLVDQESDERSVQIVE